VIPPEFAPSRTETQRIGDDIVTAVRNLRHDWPHMIAPGETQAPGITSRSGVALPDHSPSDADMRRIDRTMSLMRHIQDALNGWSRIICEERLNLHDDKHQVIPYRLPLGTDVPGMCVFIQRHAEWLGEHEAGQDCRDELKEFAQRAHQIVSPPRKETMSIGRCPLEVPTGPEAVMAECGGDVRVRPLPDDRPGEAYGSCSGCGEAAVASWWAERMFVDGEGSPLVTIGELVAVIAYRLRVVVTHEQVRQWKHRGKIESAGSDNKGRTLYRHEEVVDAIRADVRAKAAKVVG